MTRGTFIYLSVTGVAVIGASSLRCNNRDRSLNKAWRQPQFLSHICDAKTLRVIGNTYKEQFASDATENKLVDLLMTDSAGKTIHQASGSPAITSFLNNKIALDFETGNIVVIKGWVLSATEAQQCALFSLS